MAAATATASNPYIIVETNTDYTGPHNLFFAVTTTDITERDTMETHMSARSTRASTSIRTPPPTGLLALETANEHPVFLLKHGEEHSCFTQFLRDTYGILQDSYGPTPDTSWMYQLLRLSNHPELADWLESTIPTLPTSTG
jgi:hypothetical protein